MDKEKFNGSILFGVIIVVAALWFVKTFNIAYPITITTASQSTELSVVGEGKVDVVPDVAYINVGITVNNKTSVNEARSGIDSVNNKIIESLKNLGIDKKDIKTNNYSVNPNYVYENNENRINGYNGNAYLSIKVTKIDLVSQVIEAASAAGANEIQGTSFAVDKPENYREEARNKAIANAKEQAGKLAKSLGIKLGKITNIVESNNNGTVAPMYDRAVMSSGFGGGGGSPSIEPGSQTITSVVTLYFEKR
ncbi:MAG: SIMPL domain-containing protein [Patescibacteria group bacterium]|jgi:hypothetical protein